MTIKFFHTYVKSDASLGPRQISVVASDATADRAQDVMLPGGCVLTNYRKNPIVLADHDPTKPIGTADVQIRNGRVEATINFAPARISVKADEYCGLAKAGVLGAVSVGFDPIEAEPIKGGGYRFTKWELMELSVIAVPCNPGALVIGRSMPAGTNMAPDPSKFFAMVRHVAKHGRLARHRAAMDQKQKDKRLTRQVEAIALRHGATVSPRDPNLPPLFDKTSAHYAAEMRAWLERRRK